MVRIVNILLVYNRNFTYRSEKIFYLVESICMADARTYDAALQRAEDAMCAGGAVETASDSDFGPG